jgi:hypothetical protein
MAHKNMSLNALSRTPEFRTLTVRQQLWVQTYCQSVIDLGAADLVFVTQASFATEGENARTFSYQILRNPKVKACLKVFTNFGKSKRAVFLDDVRADIKASRSGSPARAKLREIEAKLIGVKPKRKSI